MSEDAALMLLAKRLGFGRPKITEERWEDVRRALVARFGGKKPELTEEQRRNEARNALVARFGKKGKVTQG